jgi:hypothetical protein
LLRIGVGLAPCKRFRNACKGPSRVTAHERLPLR